MELFGKILETNDAANFEEIFDEFQGILYGRKG